MNLNFELHRTSELHFFVEIANFTELQNFFQEFSPSIALPHLVRFGTSECSAWGGLVDCFMLWDPYFGNTLRKPFSIQRSSTQIGLPKLAGACQGFEEELFTSFKKTSSRRTAHRPEPPSRVDPQSPRRPYLFVKEGVESAVCDCSRHHICQGC